MNARKEISRINIGGSPRGSVQFDPTKSFGFVSNCAGNTVSVLDLNSDVAISKIKVGLAPRGLVLSDDGKYMFVSNSGENSLSVVDLITRKEVKKIAMGANPRHMALVPRLSRLFVSQWGSDTIGCIDLSEGPENAICMKSTPVGAGARPYSLNKNSTGKQGFVANTQSDYMSIIDMETGNETDRIKVGFGGRAVAVSDDDRFAFISTEPTNDVAVVDLEQKKVVHRVEVGPSPRGIAIAKANQELLSSNFTRSVSRVGGRNTISIIDVSIPLKAKYIDAILVGLGPCSVSVLQ